MESPSSCPKERERCFLSGRSRGEPGLGCRAWSVWILGLTRRHLPGEPGLWREGPHGVRSLCSLLAVIPSGENTRRPRHAGGGAGARTADGRHPPSTLSSASPGAPCAGNGMRGFYETTPCLLRVGFLKCENRHFKRRGTGRSRGAGRGAHRGGAGRPRLVLQSNCMASLNSDVGPRPGPQQEDTVNF